jgi:hypothetical protein
MRFSGKIRLSPGWLLQRRMSCDAVVFTGDLEVLQGAVET